MLRHATLPMEKYGTYVGGGPLHRVVWSNTRTFLAGTTRELIREIPMYPGINAWVLERHLTAFEFTGRSPEEWKLQESTSSTKLGPYPASGEWDFCYEFPYEPTDTMMSLWLTANRLSRELTAAQRKDSIMAPLLARQKRMHQKVEDMFDESMDGFRNGRSRLVGADGGPIHSTRTKRLGDHKLKLSAQDLGMPMDDNSFFTGGKHGSSSDRPGRSA